MSSWRNIHTRPRVLRYTRWEYFPMWLANIPLVFIWLFYALRSGKAMFFTNVNPAIDTGGMFGESKMDILRQLPPELLPTTVFIPTNTPFQSIIEQINNAALSYPIIVKPDVGERGQGVQKIQNETALKTYFSKAKGDFIIQEFLDYPIEVAILYYRFPDEQRGHIPSFCIKEYLKVKGDGISSVKELMAKKARANLQIERLSQLKPNLLQQIPQKDEIVELEPIGNHSRGTMFLNGNAHINADLIQIFDTISHQLEGIYYGRFDIKCESITAMQAGRDFKIMELNGIAGEAAHIYDPSYPIWKKYRDVFKCWQAIFRISKMQRKQGFKAMPLSEGIRKFRIYQAKIKHLQ